MPPTIHFVRHAQGAHNASAANETLIDPGLTELGEKQCHELRATFPHHDELLHVVTSPMRRAIQTGILSFARPGLGPVIALDLVQETSDAPNDIGSDLVKLKDTVGNGVDLSRVRQSWNDKSEGQFFEPTWEKLLHRTAEARRILRELAGGEDVHIVVIAHGGVLHYLTEDWQGLSLTHRSTWSNCEYRSYQFIDEKGNDNNAMIRETEQSWKRRRGEERQPTIEEQRALRDQVEIWIKPVLKVPK